MSINSNIVHTQKCQSLMERLLIGDISFSQKITNLLHCDYYGFNESYHVIVEYKSEVDQIGDAIVQILGYYHELTRLKIYNNGHLDKLGIKVFTPRESKLIIYYDGSEVVNFNKYIALYRSYIENPRCPQIHFVCHLDEDKLEIT